MYSDARRRSAIRGDAESTSMILTARLRSTIWVMLKMMTLATPGAGMEAEPRGIGRRMRPAAGSVDSRSTEARRMRRTFPHRSHGR